jgi:hypothetical protein
LVAPRPSSPGAISTRRSFYERLGFDVRRHDAGEPVGLISEVVQDEPWGVREFSLRDPDGNQLRVGRPCG